MTEEDGGRRRVEREKGRVLCMDGGKDDTVYKTIINRIMLRFRPIAPKPAAGDPNNDALLVDNKHKFLNQRRSKRRSVRVRRNRECKRKEKITVKDEKIYSDSANHENSIPTLQLLPERSDHLEEQSMVSGSWFSFGAKNEYHCEVSLDKTVPSDLKSRVMNSDQVAKITPEKKVMESCVTVEGVTGTCMDVQGLGCRNAERVNNLEGDTCPGFISDGHQVVRWVNDAYKRMVTVRNGNEGEQVPDLVVRLQMKDGLPYDHEFNAFTCTVRFKDAWQKEKIVPCDVCRMDGGGFLWRLDVEAALSLGR